MNQSSARRRALRELSDPDAPITPFGDCTVQDRNGSLYSLLPQPQAGADGIEGGTEMVLGYDAETHTYLCLRSRPSIMTSIGRALFYDNVLWMLFVGHLVHSVFLHDR